MMPQELLELTSLRREEKIQETELNNKIFNLTLKMNRNEATEDEHQDLAVSISMQRTKQELLELGNYIPQHKVLHYVIHQVGRATKKYQLERKKLRNNKLEELTDKLSNAIDELQVNDPAILEIEEELDNTFGDICETERSKMKTFRMINDERPTKHMINLERKIGGYCSVSRINTSNPNYVGPEHGGIDDPILKPEKSCFQTHKM